jgi:hypothetical protein
MGICWSCFCSVRASPRSDEFHTNPPTHTFTRCFSPGSFESDRSTSTSWLGSCAASEFPDVFGVPEINPLIDESRIRLPDKPRSVFQPRPSIETASGSVSGVISTTIYSAPSEKMLLKPYIQHAQAKTTAKTNGALVPHWHTVLRYLTVPPTRSLPTNVSLYLHTERLCGYIPGPVDGFLRCLLDVVKESAPNLGSVAEYYFLPLMCILIE